MVPGTSKLKRIRLQNNVQIDINGQLVSESSSEKVLGVILNNEMTFRHHLYGNDEHEGLIPQLSKRAGVLTKLSKIISPEKLTPLADNIFYSKLNYCLPVYGNVFGIERYKQHGTRYLNYTLRDNKKTTDASK